MNRFPVMAEAFVQSLLDYQHKGYILISVPKTVQVVSGAVRRYRFNYPGVL